MTIRGTFTVDPQPEPPFDTREGVSLGRTVFSKRFAGPLEGTSTVHMLAVYTPVEGSASYVAVERIVGTVEGRSGSFVVLHTATMDRGRPALALVIAPDSGTGALAGISGRMDIQIVQGQHHYELEYHLG